MGETKEAIKRIATAMCGADADVQIADTYYDTVDVKIQGVDYKWDDGKLERTH